MSCGCIVHMCIYIQICRCIYTNIHRYIHIPPYTVGTYVYKYIYIYIYILYIYHIFKSKISHLPSTKCERLWVHTFAVMFILFQDLSPIVGVNSQKPPQHFYSKAWMLLVLHDELQLTSCVQTANHKHKACSICALGWQ